MFVKVCSLCAAAVVLLLASPSPLHGQAADAKASVSTAAPPGDGYLTDPKFVDTLNKARQLERQKQAAFAADAYKKANKIAGGRCIDCVEGLYAMQMMDHSFKDAARSATELAAVASSPAVKSIAAFDNGYALLAQAGEKPKPAQLEAIHAEFQQAVALYPSNAAAWFSDGVVLARMGRMEDASSDFHHCLSCIRPDDPSRLRAQHFAADPELSTHKMAPAFEVTALDGSKFNLDAMGGRVVLIDFWATWCGPCNEELPHMRKIAKEFEGDPFVMISVSWDNDEAKWRQFIEKNDMTWVQYRDAGHKLSDEFGIDAIPHYFTIDSDGVLTSEMVGSGSDVEGRLKKLIKKAREAQTQMHSASTPTVAAGATPSGDD